MMNCRVHGMKLCKCRNERLYFNGKVNQTRSNEKKGNEPTGIPDQPGRKCAPTEGVKIGTRSQGGPFWLVALCVQNINNCNSSMNLYKCRVKGFIQKDRWNQT